MKGPNVDDSVTADVGHDHSWLVVTSVIVLAIGIGIFAWTYFGANAALVIHKLTRRWHDQPLIHWSIVDLSAECEL